MKVEQYINKLQSIQNIKYKTFGGYEDAERKIIAFYCDYTETNYSDFPIKVIKIKLLDKFCKPLNHRQYLGSILGTGIERSKLGDIIVKDNYAIAFINEAIADYVCTNLDRASHTKVETSIVELDNIEVEKKYKQIKTTVASLRLDAVISSTFNISRAKANDYINSEKVNLNWSIVKNNSLTLKEGDIFALRGYGKAKLIEILGKTNKDRFKILIYLYI